MRTFVLSLLLVTLAGALTLGSAADLGVTTSGLAAGTGSVEPCDVDGVIVDYAYTLESDPSLESATISGIDSPCLGQTLTFTILDGHGGVVLTQAMAVTSSTLPVTLPSPIPASSIASGPARITITVTEAVSFT